MVGYDSGFALLYSIKKGFVCDEPHRTELNTMDLSDFLRGHRVLFRGKRVLDLGCGNSFLRTRTDLDYKEYVGVDSESKHSPCILGDFNKITLPNGFDVVLALQILPKNLERIAELLNPGGVFIHQSGDYMYRKQGVEKMIISYFDIIEKISYLIIASYPNGDPPTLIDNIFLISTPKSSSTLPKPF